MFQESSKKKSGKGNRDTEEAVINQFKAHVKKSVTSSRIGSVGTLAHLCTLCIYFWFSRRPAKLETKWHAWKYVEYDQARREQRGARESQLEERWMGGGAGGGAGADIGWGRRIYDKNEIEVLYCT